MVHASNDQKWEIKQLGPGYTIQRMSLPIFSTISATVCEHHRVQFGPGEPERFCTPLNGLQNGTTLCVGGYPVAWRVETVDDDDYRGFGYVRSD